MKALKSSESAEANPSEANPTEDPKNLQPPVFRANVFPFAASVLAFAWLLLTPSAAFAQHGGVGGGGHAGGGGGHASGGGRSSGGAAPASHPGVAAPAGHASAPSSVVTPRASAPSASSAGAGERGAVERIEAGKRSPAGEGGNGERGGTEAAPEPAPHVVYGGYGYFVRENEPATAQHYTASSHIWQEPASRPPASVTLPSNSFTAANHMIAAPTQPATRLRGAVSARTAPRGVSLNSALIPIPVFGTGSIRFGVNNFGFGGRRGFRGRGGFGCFNFAFGPCGGFGYGFGLGFGYGYGYGLGYGYWDGGYDINPADFNAQDVTAPNAWIGDYLYEGSDEAAQVEAATAPGPLTVIYFKDGSSYGVRDYWMDAGKLHYLTSYGGENSADADRVDLQRTVDENAKNGIEFTLRPAQPGSEKP
ncbi:MAG TPA: hypothetical protein VIH76_14185 [Candidatus Acidoferrales bacterium]